MLPAEDHAVEEMVLAVISTSRAIQSVTSLGVGGLGRFGHSWCMKFANVLLVKVASGLSSFKFMRRIFLDFLFQVLSDVEIRQNMKRFEGIGCFSKATPLEASGALLLGSPGSGRKTCAGPGMRQLHLGEVTGEALCRHGCDIKIQAIIGNRNAIK